MGRDDDLVSGENTQSVFDRLQRVTVADLTMGLDADFPEATEALVEPLLSRCSRPVVVRGPVSNRGVESRADDEHLWPKAGRCPPDFLAQPVAGDSLVRDHEHTSLLQVAQTA